MTSEAQPLRTAGLASSGTLDRSALELVAGGPDAGEPPSGHEEDATRPSSGVVAPRWGGRRGRRLRGSLIALDVGCVAACWCLLPLWIEPGGATLRAAAPGVVAATSVLLAGWALGLYRARRCVRRAEELGRIGIANLAGAAAFALVQSRLGHAGPLPLAWAAMATAMLGTGRWLFGRFLRARRAEGRYLWQVVIVGSNEDAAHLLTMLRSEPELGLAVSGLIGERADDPTWADVARCSSVADVGRLAKATGATGIVIVPSALSSEQVQRAIAIAEEEKLHVHVWPGVPGVGSRRFRSMPISGEPFFYVEPPTAARWQLVVKRVVDVVGAAVLLAVAAPVLAVAAVAITLEDGGPVLYRGVRIGMDGEPFISYKLRSMTIDGQVAPEDLEVLNERTDGPLFKCSEDPRVTRVGRFLRSSSIDELPQLWNVLRGTMSLVGPRPALPGEVERFDPDLRRRHSVRPGLTGLWQVEARRNPSFHAYRRLDLQYVDNWCLRLDLEILLATLPCVLSHAVRDLVRRTGRRGQQSATAPAHDLVAAPATSSGHDDAEPQ